MLASSSPTRSPITHFSLQVLTNSRYFCRLSKKRKLRCGSASPARVGSAMRGAAVAMVDKEISLEDIRLTLQKVADRFVEHPATALVLTNLAYADAPWLAVKSLSAAPSLVWHEVPLTGTTASRFEAQITDLEPFLAENWKAGVSP